jgi:hypothetical protein
MALHILEDQLFPDMEGLPIDLVDTLTVIVLDEVVVAKRDQLLSQLIARNVATMPNSCASIVWPLPLLWHLNPPAHEQLLPYPLA